MTTKEEAKKRTILLKRLREEHKETVTRTQALLKEQKAIRKQICQTMREQPKTVPEVADSTGMPNDQLLWHITAMKKYNLIAEIGMGESFYQYQLMEAK